MSELKLRPPKERKMPPSRTGSGQVLGRRYKCAGEKQVPSGARHSIHSVRTRWLACIAPPALSKENPQAEEV